MERGCRPKQRRMSPYVAGPNQEEASLSKGEKSKIELATLKALYACSFIEEPKEGLAGHRNRKACKFFFFKKTNLSYFVFLNHQGRDYILSLSLIDWPTTEGENNRVNQSR